MKSWPPFQLTRVYNAAIACVTRKLSRNNAATDFASYYIGKPRYSVDYNREGSA
jgi:hypothetical protein